MSCLEDDDEEIMNDDRHFTSCKSLHITLLFFLLLNYSMQKKKWKEKHIYIVDNVYCNRKYNQDKKKTELPQVEVFTRNKYGSLFFF